MEELLEQGPRLIIDQSTKGEKKQGRKDRAEDRLGERKTRAPLAHGVGRAGLRQSSHLNEDDMAWKKGGLEAIHQKAIHGRKKERM
jgi:hypothetical protein